MEISEIINHVIKNRTNPNISRGFVKPLTMEKLTKLHEWFNSECFKTKDIKDTLYHVRDHIYIEPTCNECGKRVKASNRFCGRSCASKQPKHFTEENRRIRESIRYECSVCGKKIVKTKGHNCVSCGNKSQAKKMKLLWKNDFDRMNALCQKPRTVESRLMQSNKIKKLILDGKFTPKSNNRFTHRSAKFDGIPFRSTWEQRVYRYFKDVKGIKLEFETLRIEYEFNNRTHVYIVDFIDMENKRVYEIKPNSMVDEQELAKEQTLINWAKANGFKYTFISEDWINERNLFKKYKI